MQQNSSRKGLFSSQSNRLPSSHICLFLMWLQIRLLFSTRTIEDYHREGARAGGWLRSRPRLQSRSLAAARQGRLSKHKLLSLDASLNVDLQALAIEETREGSLGSVLAALELSKYTRVFLDEEIDLAALLLLSESNLKELSIPMGPRKKLLRIIAQIRRKQAAVVSRHTANGSVAKLAEPKAGNDSSQVSLGSISGRPTGRAHNGPTLHTPTQQENTLLYTYSLHAGTSPGGGVKTTVVRSTPKASKLEAGCKAEGKAAVEIEPAVAQPATPAMAEGSDPSPTPSKATSVTVESSQTPKSGSAPNSQKKRPSSPLGPFHLTNHDQLRDLGERAGAAWRAVPLRLVPESKASVVQRRWSLGASATSIPARNHGQVKRLNSVGPWRTDLLVKHLSRHLSTNLVPVPGIRKKLKKDGGAVEATEAVGSQSVSVSEYIM